MGIGSKEMSVTLPAALIAYEAISRFRGDNAFKGLSVAFKESFIAFKYVFIVLIVSAVLFSLY